MDLKGIVLSVISQTEQQLPYDFTYMWNLKNKTKQKQTYRNREQSGGYQRGGAGGTDEIGEGD